MKYIGTQYKHLRYIIGLHTVGTSAVIFIFFRFGCEAAEVRALVEGQVLAKRIHAQNMGFKICKHVSIK